MKIADTQGDDRTQEYLDAIDAVCLVCVRPDADAGGEEACEACYVRKTYLAIREQ